MCAIAGYFGSGDKKTLLSMLNAISHRGPDDQGIYIDGQVGIGNNRLAIIDLSIRGRQPLFSKDKNLSIVFNGEIYNFKEIKKLLLHKYEFISNTDTEVILHAYSEWGIKCLDKLNGMFAFVIYDKSEKILFGARDRLGEKPLKYFFDGINFAFASEIKGLLPYLKNKPTIDPIAINHFLSLQYVPSPSTGFKNFYKLPPGHFFIFKNRKLSIKKYWSVSFSNKLSLSEEEWEKILFEKLMDSVKSRLIADVPLGVFLSGGIDSSAVVALMSKVTSQKIKTFSISFDDPRFDESKYSNQVAKKYRTVHKTFRVTSKIMGNIFEKLPEFYDEPFADNSSIPMIALCRFAGRSVKVALTGDGGDENFAGYERYKIVKFSDIYSNFPIKLRKNISFSVNLADKLISTKFNRRIKIYANTFNEPFYYKYLYYSCFFQNIEKYSLYSNEFMELVNKYDSFNLFKSLYNIKTSDLDNALNIDIKTYLPEDLLYKTDIASMANSIETRAPFLNHELIELTAKIPSNLKIKFFQNKYIFKKILEKNDLVSKEIIHRRKKGFVAPIGRWLKEDYKDMVFDSINSKKFKDCHIFDQARLKLYTDSFYSGKNVSANNIFALLVLANWINKYT